MLFSTRVKSKEQSKVISKSVISKTVISLAIGASLLFANQAMSATKTYQEIQKQLSIMNDIIRSSIAQKGTSRNQKPSVSSIYLQGQGVVFTIDYRLSGLRWRSSGFNVVMPEIAPLAPLAPLAPVAPKVDVDFSEHENSVAWSYSSSSSFSDNFEQAIELAAKEREQARDLRDEQRDIAYQIRDALREKKDIEYQLRRADKNSQKELNQELKALEKQRVSAIKMQNKMAIKVKEMKISMQKQRAENTQKRKQHYQTISTSLAETLCLYGNGLKALPKSERVSVILTAAGEKVARRYADQIFVFTKKDIADCSIDKIDAKKLLAKANSYQF